MANFAVDLTEQIILSALRSVVLQMVPTGVEVIRAQVNRAPEPMSNTFILLTRTNWDLIEFPTVTWDHSDPNPISLNMFSPVKATVQLDIHGDNGADISWIIASTFKSFVAFDLFAALNSTGATLEGYALPVGAVIRPLYADSPRQAPFVDGEDQYEDRWIVETAIQANINISITQDFANTLTAGLIDVDAVYPP